ncbi:MAG: PepSY domain-containing protein [Sphaerotilus natans subsp. sulfidivorans]|uniref:PepSY-associated TM helix domain-containing protein n=1 Tax=Sphaerotilus sulfidivorans TaxID=639200 RepID=UPI002352F966|nr:PepSY-associated TM helix domain-containing protein [Sphaerotilus sulfidivorans]MCK6403799.1 PepSY domain-containing protein [Sphaerotilus sulfidivorans]
MSAVSPRARRVWLQIHKVLGLALGLWFLLMGVTGSLLVYYRGLEAQLDARLREQPGVTAPAKIAEVHRTLVAAHPQRGTGWRIEVPPRPGEPVTARFLKPVETQGAYFAPLLATTDPSGRTLVANRFWGETPGTWIYDLHFSLLGGELGVKVVGWGGVALAASLVSGLVIWWPARGRWRQALRLRGGVSTVRRVYDLHTVFGALGGVLLLILALTGSAMALPDLVKPMIASVSPLTPVPRPAVPPPAEAAGPRLDADAAIARAMQAFPGAQVRWIDTPATDGGLYRIRLRQPGEPGDRFPDTLVWIDSTRGEIVARRDPRHFSAGDTVWQWMHPLHSGEGFGPVGRLLVCLCGVLPVLLAVTGLWRWLDKRRARRRASARQILLHPVS